MNKCAHGSKNPFLECNEDASKPCAAKIPHIEAFEKKKNEESIGSSAVSALTRGGVKKL